MSAPSALAPFGPATQAWFRDSFAAPTAVQEQGWRAISEGEHALLCAPTGSGKTLAAFLWCVDRLLHGAWHPPGDDEPGFRAVYISPMKALAYDVERNLRAPLLGIQRTAEREQVPFRPVVVSTRTGDTSQKERARQKRKPGDILITTPESFYLLLTSQARENLRTIRTVIIDEIHVLAPTKRGAHLALSLERLAELTDDRPQRIGLSATQRPLALAGKYLGGDRSVTLVDTSSVPNVDLTIEYVDSEAEPPAELPVFEDGTELDPDDEDFGFGQSLLLTQATADVTNPLKEAEKGIWPGVYRRLLECIAQHRTTLVFVNNRRLAERIAQRLNELAGREIALPHHGSLAHQRRTEVEEALKAGRTPAIIATSSLELGIDMGSIDLVVLVESPGAVSRGLQRIGRAGHQVGATSKGIIIPKFPGDLVECAVVSKEMCAGAVEAMSPPTQPLDVLSQQVVAMVADRDRTVPELLALARRAHSYRELSRSGLETVLDMLSGRYPSDEFADLRPRINWDRQTDTLTARRSARGLAVANAGTIPDRGLYAVHLGADGPRIGELDEEMVYESRAGETFTLGASTWRVLEITRDRVIVEPAPGEPGKMPFWRGEGPGRPAELGRKLGAFLRQLEGMPDSAARTWLTQDYGLDPTACDTLLEHVREQSDTAAMPTDQRIVVERFRDALGDWRVCVLSPFGSPIHAPWAIAVEASLTKRFGYEVRALWTDDGFALQFADADEPPPVESLIPDVDGLRELLLEQLGDTALFASRFREAAGRALLLPKRRPGQRTPLWAQRQRSAKLLATAKQYPAFPIVLECYRECLSDVFDREGLTTLLAGIHAGSVQLQSVETDSPSPFARSLAYAYVAAYLYDGDAPLAERRAQALTLDRTLLRELLGDEELRELLDPQSIIEVEEELQGLAENWRARDPDTLHDLLRRVGDLSVEELAERCTEDPAAWLESLHQQRRAFPAQVATRPVWVAVEDVARLRDGVGVVPPASVPAAFLETAEPERSRDSLVYRYARTHGPFVSRAPLRRYGLSELEVEGALARLESQSKVASGGFLPHGRGREWCEVDVLRRIRQRSLAKLRKAIAPVDGATYAQFLASWQGVGSSGRGRSALAESLTALEGCALPFSDLESSVLPARVAQYQSSLLDELGALGELVWVGRGSLGAKDGRVALYRRESVGALVRAQRSTDAPEPPGEMHRAVLDHLARRGACFTAELHMAAGKPRLPVFVGILSDLAWGGFITNDTPAAVRSLPGAKAASKRAGRRGVPLGGRWSLVAELGAFEESSDTERLHALAYMLLHRYGVVGRAAAQVEHIPGGFSALYDVYRALEDAGKVRRGHFVDGIEGIQFALTGAVDRLRSSARPREGNVTSVLSAIDPANPYGSILPWPLLRSAEVSTPRRVAGARVVFRSGRPVLYVESTGKALVTFETPDESDLETAASVLTEVAAQRKGRILQLERIDGEPAGRSPLSSALRRAGFESDYRGLVLEAGYS